MRDIIIVPTYDRPEMLWVCLEKLRAARGIGENKEIWICEDKHYEKEKDGWLTFEYATLLPYFEREFGRYMFRHFYFEPHGPSYGNSRNVVDGFKRAIVEYLAKQDVRYIYLIEDDAMVTEDFFEWNEKAHDLFKPFATCAGRINRSLNFESNGPEAIDETFKEPGLCVRSRKAYMSWATCFHPEDLRNAMTYEFTSTVWAPGKEQDIEVQKRIRKLNLTTVWPYVPRAYHMGWYSYHLNSGMPLSGTLEEKVKAIKRIMTNASAIRDVAGLAQIDPYPTKPIAWDSRAPLQIRGDYK